MHILNKEELKEVTGGLTAIEYGLLAAQIQLIGGSSSLISDLQVAGFSDTVNTDIFQYVIGNNFKVLLDMLTGNASEHLYNIFGHNLMVIADKNTKQIAVATTNYFHVFTL